MERNDEGTDAPRSGNFSVRKFDGRNFKVWKAQIEAFLQLKDCWQAVVNRRPLNTSDDKLKPQREREQTLWDDRNSCAKATLLLSLSDSVAFMVIGLKTARDIWSRLIDSYELKSQSSRIVMQRNFFDCQMKEGEKIVGYVARVQDIFNQLLDSGVKLDEETLVSRIVSGLTPKFHVFMTHWANNTLMLQTMSELIPRLLAEESLVAKMDRHEPVAMYGETKKSSRPRKWSPREHGQSSSRDAQQESKYVRKKPDKSTLTCHNCGELGHFRAECKKKKNQKQVIYAEGMVAHAYLTEKSRDVTTWILDSGASDHMCCDKLSFSAYRSFLRPRVVRFGGQGTLKAIGIGSIPMVSSPAGVQKYFVLRNALYVPGLRRKLISIGAATSHSWKAEMEDGHATMRNKNGEVIMEAVLENGLYHCRASEVKNDVALIAQNDDSATDNGEPKVSTDCDLKLWHERMAHINKPTIVRMKKLEAVDGLEKARLIRDAKGSQRKVIDCDACCMAKHTRQFIPESTRDRSEIVGQYVHVDICGPFPPSLSKAKYFVLYKDEASTYRHVYFVSTKDLVFRTIQQCVAQIRSDTTRSVSCLVSDNGSELTSNRTKTFLAENGIVQKVTAPYTPHQNGLIERDNRTILEAMRAMMFHSQLPPALWAEAVNTAVYVLNRTLNRVTKTKTPFEIYFGRRPRVSQLRIFGSLAFLKPQEKKRKGYQKKLDARSMKMIMVGYDPTRDYTYRLYYPEKNEIVISREVLFDEARVNETGRSVNYDFLDELFPSETDLEGEQEVASGEESEIEAQVNLSVSQTEPASHNEALASPEAEHWKKAIQEEYESLVKNKTWQLDKPPANIKPVPNKWVLKLKTNADGSIARYKARLVAKGFKQRHGIDYEETFSPVVRLDSVRTILSIATRDDLELIHFDVKTAFLNGDLSEEIWMSQPEGFVEDSSKACRLIKSLYGLKQASRVWNQCFVNFLKKYDLEPTRSDSCVLTRSGKDMLIVAIWVDDGLACSSNATLLKEVVAHLKERFEITLMEAECFVGLQIYRDRERRLMMVNQRSYLEKVVERFGLKDALPSVTPMLTGANYVKTGVADGVESKAVIVPYREAIGSLNYAMCGTRPDIACAVSILSRFCEKPRLAHWEAVKRVIRYIKGTINLSLMYEGEKCGLLAYSDADYGGCRDSRKSMTGLIITSCGGPIIWKSTKQTTVAESTTEAEFIACSSLSREVIWVRNFLEESLHQPLTSPTELRVDNQSTIKLISNNQTHSSIKHIDIRLMAVRERLEERKIKVVHVSTDEQLADIMTKPLAPQKFTGFRQMLNMVLMSLTLMMVTAESVQAFRVTFDKVSGGGIQETRRMFLKMTNPCLVAQTAEESLRGIVELNFDAKLNTSLIEITKNTCKNVFEGEVTKAFNGISGCLSSNRAKRDITAVATAVSAAASMIVGVTNLIRGSYEEAPITTRKETFQSLEAIVDEGSKLTLTDRGVRNAELEQDLIVVSGAARQHLEQVRDVADQVPMLIWATYHVCNELYAGAANLKAIKQQCAAGRLATQELGEMLEMPYLLRLDPRDTELLQVSVNPKEHEIEFLYSVKRIVSITRREVGNWSAWCSGSDEHHMCANTG